MKLYRKAKWDIIRGVILGLLLAGVMYLRLSTIATLALAIVAALVSDIFMETIKASREEG